MRKRNQFTLTYRQTIIGLGILLGSLSNFSQAKDINLLLLSSLSVGDAHAYETCPAVNPPIKHAEFVVNLQRNAEGPIETETVNFATQDGSALSGVNYIPVSGTLTFLPGETTKLVPVKVLSSYSNGDSYFYLVLSNPSIQTTYRDFHGVASIAHLDSGNEACRKEEAQFTQSNVDPKLPNPPPIPK